MNESPEEVQLLMELVSEDKNIRYVDTTWSPLSCNYAIFVYHKNTKFPIACVVQDDLNTSDVLDEVHKQWYTRKDK